MLELGCDPDEVAEGKGVGSSGSHKPQKRMNLYVSVCAAESYRRVFKKCIFSFYNILRSPQLVHIK